MKIWIVIFVVGCENQELWCPESEPGDQISIDRPGKSPGEPTQGPNTEKTQNPDPDLVPKNTPDPTPFFAPPIEL